MPEQSPRKLVQTKFTSLDSSLRPFCKREDHRAVRSIGSDLRNNCSERESCRPGDVSYIVSQVHVQADPIDKNRCCNIGTKTIAKHVKSHHLPHFGPDRQAAFLPAAATPTPTGTNESTFEAQLQKSSFFQTRHLRRVPNGQPALFDRGRYLISETVASL